MHMYVVGVVCIRVCTYINTYAHVRGGCSVYTSVYIHLHMHMYVVGVVCIRVCTYINTYAHVRGGCSVYTSVYIHQYICTCTWWV